ncbi:hypothetical protein FMM08_12190 [Quadrisphaera setariae]|uniref:Glycosyl hydrolase family 32 N-terminal domain-containing protein n=1 Tax=Quadrisphaera setariae TaxID=2593304 RepID=A0A5C8ZDJ5_9ACTN|nr:hypothetical protein FMM08_12190 [Quadrisphaera setariae]
MTPCGVATGVQGENAWAPEAIWDPASNACVIYWASNAPAAEGGTKHQILYATTTDFGTWGRPARAGWVGGGSHPSRSPPPFRGARSQETGRPASTGGGE